ncbi:purine nucleoside phosphorylase [Metamycoplasma arthritidis]|uniref:Uridine phosphorylase n=1 Tax=Metamycoplasma arthritidis (strain 158L3-1) TaxID=243272 RepID=B3PM93_META1|nr:purine-nucleoside phosphorylase [Metamycoplasma arthritidis]ACF07145.1 purine nucleoside phosphorylase [Metamycoplasma arthritidis 158L3-1]VEU78670.1 purine nucleoside phosphorylase [Metamycoplasma arthritidis]
MTPHINAKDGAFAKLVLMPGDPLRAKFIADNFLEDAKLVSDVRNVLMYTGYYQGNKVSVCASGMGTASIGIYSFELFNEYGVEAIVRIGSAGSFKAEIKNFDVILAKDAYGENVAFRESMIPNDRSNIATPDKKLNALILKNAKELNMPIKEERVLTEEAFYTTKSAQDRVELSGGAVCVEMESYSLFSVAERLNKKAACILTISDNLITHEYTTSEQRQNSFKEMMKLALSLAKDFQ